MGDESMGSTTMIKAIRQARDDATVKAVVLRVDSPGGSALASDLMWHELETLDGKKPFVVSMGDVAASGGYYIAMGADRIFAEPGTLTGSIGVVGGKLAFEKFYEKIGITTSVVQRGKNSGVLSMTTPFSDAERDTMQKMLNDIYAQFTTKAAAGRKMDVEKLEKMARGRVYTGAQALQLGLIDEIGTLADAIAHAKKAAGLDPEQKLERLDLPKPISPFEQLFGPADPGAASLKAASSAWLRRLPPEVSDSLKGLEVYELLARERVLTVMPYHHRQIRLIRPIKPVGRAWSCRSMLRPRFGIGPRILQIIQWRNRWARKPKNPPPANAPSDIPAKPIKLGGPSS